MTQLKAPPESEPECQTMQTAWPTGFHDSTQLLIQSE